LWFERVENHPPWVERDPLATGPWLMKLKNIRTVQQSYPFLAELLDAALEGRVLGLRGVDERQGDNRQALADGLGEQAESKGVADPGRPLVDRVEGWASFTRTRASRAGGAAQTMR